MRMASLCVPGWSIVDDDDPACGDEAGVLLSCGCGAGRAEPVGSIDAASAGVNTGTAHASESTNTTPTDERTIRNRMAIHPSP